MSDILFESTESIYAKSKYREADPIEYSVIIKIKNSGKNPVSLKMKLVPPQPLVQEVKEEHVIKAETLSEAFAKAHKFLKRYGFELY